MRRAAIALLLAVRGCEEAPPNVWADQPQLCPLDEDCETPTGPFDLGVAPLDGGAP